MTSLDIIGTFSIMGSNQDANENWYKGKLDLSLDQNNRIIAKWTINGNQEQFGTGFFKNNILVIQFNYKDIEDKNHKGIGLCFISFKKNIDACQKSLLWCPIKVSLR